MPQIKYVHAIKFDDGEQRVRSGKGKRKGSVLVIPTPDNDREGFKRRERERVDYWHYRR